MLNTMSPVPAPAARVVIPIVLNGTASMMLLTAEKVTLLDALAILPPDTSMLLPDCRLKVAGMFKDPPLWE